MLATKCLLLLGVACPALALTTAKAVQEPSALETARDAVAEGDADHDGALNKLEFVHAIDHDKGLQGAVFEALDPDHDGKLDAEPFMSLETIEEDPENVMLPEDEGECGIKVAVSKKKATALAKRIREEGPETYACLAKLKLWEKASKSTDAAPGKDMVYYTFLHKENSPGDHVFNPKNLKQLKRVDTLLKHCQASVTADVMSACRSCKLNEVGTAKEGKCDACLKAFSALGDDHSCVTLANKYPKTMFMMANGDDGLTELKKTRVITHGGFCSVDWADAEVVGNCDPVPAESSPVPKADPPPADPPPKGDDEQPCTGKTIEACQADLNEMPDPAVVPPAASEDDRLGEPATALTKMADCKLAYSKKKVWVVMNTGDINDDREVDHRSPGVWKALGVPTTRDEKEKSAYDKSGKPFLAHWMAHKPPHGSMSGTKMGGEAGCNCIYNLGGYCD